MVGNRYLSGQKLSKKMGFWFKIATEPSLKPQVHLRRIEDLKRVTNKDIGLKDILDIVSKCSTGRKRAGEKGSDYSTPE